MYSKKARGAQEAHEAIRPTLISREPEELRRYLASEQLRLYDLIWKRMLASQMADVVADSTRVDVEASGPQTRGRSYMFRATGSVVKFPGFRALYSEDRDEASEEDEGGDRQLPDLSIGEVLNCLGLGSEQHFTQPPPALHGCHPDPDAGGARDRATQHLCTPLCPSSRSATM